MSFTTHVWIELLVSFAIIATIAAVFTFIVFDAAVVDDDCPKGKKCRHYGTCPQLYYWDKEHHIHAHRGCLFESRKL